MELNFNAIKQPAFVVAGLALGALATAQWEAAGMTVTDQLNNIRGSHFVENRGQWESDALFQANRPGLAYWATKSGVVLDLYKIDEQGEGTDDDMRVGDVITMSLDGATGMAQPEGAGAHGMTFDFLVGDSPQTGVRAFGEAYVNNIKPNTHMRHYVRDGALRYDFLIMPGGGEEIRLNITGHKGLRINENGELVIRTSIGELTHGGLKAYQPIGNRHILRWPTMKVEGDQVVISVDEYDERLPLVIDPFVYGSYLGSDPVPFFSTGFEQVLDLSVDADGNLYATGHTNSITFPITDGPYGFNLAGGLDVFLTRLEADAFTLDYAAYIGGSDDETGRGIEFNGETGELWIAGYTSSNDFPGATNAFTGPNTDFFLTKFTVNADLSITPNFSTYFSEAGDQTFSVPSTQPNGYNAGGLPGYNLNDSWVDLVSYSDGSVGLVGQGDNGTLVGNGYAPFLAGAGGGTDGFVARFNPAGSITGRVLVGSQGNDTIGGAAVDPADNTVVSGAFGFVGNQDTSTAPAPHYPTTDGVYTNGRLIRNGDAFIAKLNSGFGTVFSSILGGSVGEVVADVAVDPTGDIYILGQSNSFNYPRTPGVYDEDPADVGTGSFVTKVASDGASFEYSTGLRHQETVVPWTIDVDARGVVAVGGTVGFRYPGGPPPQNTIPGSIPTTPDAIDGAYNGGDESVGPPNNFFDPDPMNPDLNAYRSSCEGFVQFLNASATDVLYADYIGGGGDDTVNVVLMDAVGATWVGGNTTPEFNRNGVPKPIVGLPAGYISPTAFRDQPDTGSTDGFAIKFRVELPILNAVSFNPGAIAGGLGASSQATINLREPAPTGGVTLELDLQGTTAASFSPSALVTTTNAFIPEGTQTIQVEVFSRPVQVQTNVDLKVKLDNDFIVARLVVNPWLTDFTITPSTVVGGNLINVRVRLFQDAINPIDVPISTDRADLINLPDPAVITVPAGASSATIQIDTEGVDTTQVATLTSNLLGVSRNATATLTRASLASLTFDPNRVNAGEDSQMTVSLNGDAGTDRSVDLAVLAGEAGLQVDSAALPQTVVIPSGERSATFTATAPFVAGPSFTTVQATDGPNQVEGTLFIDDIDIQDIIFTPATDIISGEIITGRVTLTNPAGPNGFTVNLTNSNTAAGTLSTNQVTVPSGSLESPTFTFTANAVATDQTTDVCAEKPGFTTQCETIIVRAIELTLTLNPDTVTGGLEDSVGTISLDNPAPSNGLDVQLTSSDPAVASVPASVTVPGGGTTATFDIMTSKVTQDTSVIITAEASSEVGDTATLQVETVDLVDFFVDPTFVVGGDSTTGTVVIEDAAPAGGIQVQIAATPNGNVSFPATVTIPEGDTQASFTIDTTPVGSDTQVNFTATLEGTTLNTSMTILAPAIVGITFSPAKVEGGDPSVGTITLDQPAPAGGITVSIMSENETFARPTVSTVTIPAGQTSATFNVTTSPVSRLIAIPFVAETQNSFFTGYLYLKP